MSDPSDVTNAMRGHKAAISNPHVSEEAKEHSRQVLKAMEGKDKTGGGGEKHTSRSGGGEKQTSRSDSSTSEGKDPGNVARGLKAAIHNPVVSEEAKEHSKQKLAELEGKNKTGGGGEKQTSSSGGGKKASSSGGEKHTSSGGGQKKTSRSDSSTSEGKDPGNVARGLKAAISNPVVSEEAKENAKQKLANLEGGQ